MSIDNIDEPTELNNDNLQYNSTYKPWTTVIRGRSTCTANVCHIQKELLDKKKKTNYTRQHSNSTPPMKPPTSNQNHPTFIKHKIHINPISNLYPNGNLLH